ncbi:hypothetical protein PR003_g31721 [Phytophthora rubi]|uniref:Uncharacterized protein n=1 Tax=Phytophthora rubi TaxID=129364 RepID=A0A6A3GR62_9STRA|nr:hypothetical protein PR002_g30572 [Phytophthora rubi]KAE8959391.1 hypothetical protein PR001_g30731 [Phytophthora rubi]KAE9267612.1 hypothetical protein PR003_g31721 [Phytophthora rubi]
MGRTRGTRDLAPETKVAVALFLVDLAARGTGATAAVAAAVEAFPLKPRTAWQLAVEGDVVEYGLTTLNKFL